MAIKLGSALLGVGRDDDRLSPGFAATAGVTFIGGTAATQDFNDSTGKTLTHFNGAADIDPADNIFPLGLVLEDSNPFPRPASGDSSAGAGFDIQDYAKGDLFSVFHRPGNFADIFDDGRDATQVKPLQNAGGVATTNFQNQSAPFIVEDTWALGAAVYATVTGLLTTVKPTSADAGVAATDPVARIGRVRAVDGSGANLKIALELDLGVEIAA